MAEVDPDRLQAQVEVAWEFADTMADHGRYPDVRNWGTRMLQALAEARDRSDPELPDHEEITDYERRVLDRYKVGTDMHVPIQARFGRADPSVT